MKSYCRSRTRKRLWSLGLAILLLLMAAAAVVYGWMKLQEDKSAWNYEEYVRMTIGWAGVILFGASGIVTAYTALRDAFFPAKSALARSIRSQLPYPEEAPEVRELFAMVDRDIAENGLWFDRVAVGKEWVLGDEAARSPAFACFLAGTRPKHAGAERGCRLPES